MLKSPAAVDAAIRQAKLFGVKDISIGTLPKGVKSVAGMGLMLGIEPVAPVGPIVEKLLAKGVVVITAKEKIRLLPALNIPMEQLKKAVAIMKDVLAEE